MILWQTPAFFITSILLQVIHHRLPFYTTFILGIGVGIFLTTLDFSYQVSRPKYFIQVAMFPSLEHVIVMLALVTSVDIISIIILGILSSIRLSPLMSSILYLLVAISTGFFLTSRAAIALEQKEF